MSRDSDLGDMNKERHMNISLLNPVVLAENYEKLIDWYVKTFDLKIQSQTQEGESYTELEHSGKLVVGIAKADEMGIKPTVPRNNTVIIQLAVSDINSLFDTVRKSGGRILFGPSLDEKGGYVYGGCVDIEGNQIWIVEKKED